MFDMLENITITNYIVLSAILFTVGVLGIFINRKNAITTLMCIELILLSVNINFISFSVQLHDITGQVFSLFILTVAAAETAIGLAILILLFRNKNTIALDEINQ